MLDAVLWLMENRAPQSIVDRDDSIVDKRARSTSPLLLKGTKNASMKALNDTTQPATDVVAEKMEQVQQWVQQVHRKVIFQRRPCYYHRCCGGVAVRLRAKASCQRTGSSRARQS